MSLRLALSKNSIDAVARDYNKTVARIAAFPTAVAPEIQRRMENLVIAIFTGSGSTPDYDYNGTAWDALAWSTLRRRARKSFSGGMRGLQLARVKREDQRAGQEKYQPSRWARPLLFTGSLLRSLVPEGSTITGPKNSRTVQITSSDVRFNSLFAGAPERDLPARPMLPVGEGYWRVARNLGSSVIIPLFEAELEREAGNG